MTEIEKLRAENERLKDCGAACGTVGEQCQKCLRAMFHREVAEVERLRAENTRLVGEVERRAHQLAKAFEGYPNGYHCYCKRMTLAVSVHVHHNAVTRWTHGQWWCGAWPEATSDKPEAAAPAPNHEAQAQIDALADALEGLGSRYGVDHSDPSAPPRFCDHAAEPCDYCAAASAALRAVGRGG